MSQKPEHLDGDRWRVRRYVGLDPGTGKQRQVSRTFRADGIRAAERKAAQVLAKLDRELAEVAANKGTVAELAGLYEANRLAMGRWAPTNAKRQHEIIKVIVADLGARRCADLNSRHVDAWYATLLDRKLSPRTVHHYSATLRAMLKQGAKWDMASDRPVQAATLPSVTTVEAQPPTNDVLAVLLSSSTGALRAALAVATYTGCRRGEVVGLRWSDFTERTLDVRRSVCEVDGKLTVKVPKSRKSRRFTVDPALIDMLAEWRTSQNDTFRKLGREVPADCFVFADLRHDGSGQTPRRPGWLSLAWHRHRTAHGAESVRLHDLRHWHLSTLAAAGVPMVTVQARGGHADISTTGIYSHALPEGEALTEGVITRALQAGAKTQTAPAASQ